MMALRANVDPTSVREVQRALEGIKEGVKNRVLKQSIGKVARRTANDARQRAPKGPSGTLQKSMGTRYRSYRRGERWLYAIGPRTKFKGIARHQPKGRPLRWVRFTPTKYAHLAEKGRGSLTVKRAKMMQFYPTPEWGADPIYRKKVGPARGYRFMAKAWRLLDSPSARFTRFLTEDILAGIDREAAKYAAKGKSIAS